jgi:hypothetical protein
MTAGQALMRLGQALRLSGISRLGANLVARALEQAPRLSEALLGRQEAALQALLRLFRDGNQEEALRRALPLQDGAARGPAPPAGGRLPRNNILYSLAALLGADGGGRAPVWQTSRDVYNDLLAEYRKAAHEAARRGDWRRAAYIHGKLLRNFRAAADALFAGGLYHDAAVLYLKLVGDRAAAARAFERAGETDEAVRLYRELGDHLSAAEALRRAGEEEQAVAEYVLAATQLAARKGWLAAGELLLGRAGLPDAAASFFRTGWERRPNPDAVSCAVRLARRHTAGGERDRLLALVGEAEPFFAAPGDEAQAAVFYNEIARLAARDNLEPIRAELRDRARRGLAVKLRQRATLAPRPGDVVSELMGRSQAWPAAVVTDAQFAFTAAVRRPAERRDHTHALGVSLGTGTVTAVGHAAESGDVFVGFANGEIVCHRAGTGGHVRFPPDTGPVLALATDVLGRMAIALRESGPEGALCSYLAEGPAFVQYGRVTRALGPGACLTPQVLAVGLSCFVGLYDGSALEMLVGQGLQTIWSDADSSPLDAALLGPADGEASLSVLGVGAGRLVRCRQRSAECPLGWTPRVPAGSPLRAPPLAWHPRSATELELAGLGADGTVYWSLVQFARNELRPVAMSTSAESGYRGVAIVRPGVVAAVGPSRVDWLRGGGRTFAWSSTRVSLSRPIACFLCRPTDELIVVCGNGTVARVPVLA